MVEVVNMACWRKRRDDKEGVGVMDDAGFDDDECKYFTALLQGYGGE